MDGSFITEVHVAGGISLPAWAWANASCWANQLDDHNTGTAPLSAPPSPPPPLPLTTVSINTRSSPTAFTLARLARDQRHVRQPPV